MRGLHSRTAYVSDAKRLKQLGDENRKLKQLVAELSLDKRALEYFLSKKP